jgi:hypothetical protein
MFTRSQGHGGGGTVDAGHTGTTGGAANPGTSRRDRTRGGRGGREGKSNRNARGGTDNATPLETKDGDQGLATHRTDGEGGRLAPPMGPNVPPVQGTGVGGNNTTTPIGTREEEGLIPDPMEVAQLIAFKAFLHYIGFTPDAACYSDACNKGTYQYGIPSVAGQEPGGKHV